MADEPEVIRQQMEESRATLAEKLETLEHKIMETVQGAKDTVNETVETVKDTVQSSVDAVKDTFQSSVDSVKDTVSSSVGAVADTLDLPRQVERHPWAMFGGAIAVGYVGGMLLGRVGQHGGYSPAPHAARYSGAGSYAPQASGGPYRGQPQGVASGGMSSAGSTAGSAAQSVAHTASHVADTAKSWAGDLSEAFAPELRQLKGLAIGALISAVRDAVTRSLPEQVKPQVNEMLNNVTSRLGGQPMQGGFLNELLPQQEHHRAHDGPRNASQGSSYRA